MKTAPEIAADPSYVFLNYIFISDFSRNQQKRIGLG